MAKSKKPRRNQTDKSKEVLDESKISENVSDSIETVEEVLSEDPSMVTEVTDTLDAEVVEAAGAIDDVDAAPDKVADSETDTAPLDSVAETVGPGESDVVESDDVTASEIEETNDGTPDPLVDEIEKTDEIEKLEDVTLEPEPEVAPAPTPTPQPEPRQSGFLPLVFGGVVAAMIGFLLGRAEILDAVLPESMQRKAPDLTALETEASELRAQTADLTAQTEALAATVAELQAAEPAAASVDTSALDAAIEELNAKIDALEARPVVAEGSPELEALVGNLETTITNQAEEIAALRDGVASVTQAEQSAAQATLALAALTRVEAALATGEAYAPALADLEATGVIDIPSELAAVAGEGVPTMASLSADFPDAARAALAATRAEDASGGGVDLGAFLTRQLGVRSVLPREGDDPDAVLSRAEAALQAGDLTAALAEIDALPDVAKSELSNWLDQAQTRQIALDAANAMAQSLTAN